MYDGVGGFLAVTLILKEPDCVAVSERRNLNRREPARKGEKESQPNKRVMMPYNVQLEPRLLLFLDRESPMRMRDNDVALVRDAKQIAASVVTKVHVEGRSSATHTAKDSGLRDLLDCIGDLCGLRGKIL